jgi:WD40 repeat protein
MIRNFEDFTVFTNYICVDKIDYFAFSPDSCYILCAMNARNAIQVFSLADKEWKCRINESVAGMVYVTWSPDSRSVVSLSDFGIQLSIWSLTDGTCSIINNPKSISTNLPGQNVFAFSDCEKFLSVIIRSDLQDYIGIYSTYPLKEISKFKARSNDAAFILWVPSGLHVIVIDSPLTYKLHVYLPSGEVFFKIIVYFFD